MRRVCAAGLALLVLAVPAFAQNATSCAAVSDIPTQTAKIRASNTTETNALKAIAADVAKAKTVDCPVVTPPPPTTVLVPNVLTETQAAATSAITALGLTVTLGTPTTSSAVPSGSVLSESPAAGTSVNVGSAVTLTISTGPQAPTTCTDPSATNVGQPLPCTYPPPPVTTGAAILDDFSQGIRQVPGYGPLWSHYTEGASGSVAVVNGALVETVGAITNSNNGGAYLQFTPKTNDSYAFPNGYAQHYVLSGAWNTGFNRLSFTMTANRANGRSSNGSDNVQVGTYVRAHTDSDAADQGAHYYHQLAINFTANRKVYVFLSDVPQHQVGVQNTAPGEITGYMDNLTRFYVDGVYGGLGNAQVTYDDFTFSQASGEPVVQVGSVWATYNGSSYEVGWNSPENSTLVYTLYCAPVSMHANGLSAGTACGTTQGTGDTYIAGPYVKTANMAQPAGGMYLAIVPSGSSTFREVYVPNN